MAFSIVGTPATSTSSTLAQSNTAGNTLFIGLRQTGATSANGITITDTQKNLWKLVSFVKNANHLQLFMCQSCKGGANTITINGTVSFYLWIHIEVSSDVAGITVLDSAHATQIGSGTGANFTTQPIRLSGSSGFVLGLVGNETANSLTFSNTGSFIQAAAVSGNTALYYILNDTNASETFSGTYSSAVSWECLIASFKRVSIPQGAGIWVDKGIAIAPVSSDQPGQPNVFYEAGAKIITPNADGKVFKMLFGTTAGMCYAESNTGLPGNWTRYGSNPVISTAAHDYPRVYKIGSTYYCYDGVQAGPIKAYTASDLAGPWTLQNASALAVSQTWENAGFFGQLNITGQDGGGTWHGYYASLSSAYLDSNYAQGHATSTDLINWTKDTNNPTLVLAGASQMNNTILVSGVYYAWSQIVQPGIPPNLIASVPSDVGRLSATSPSGPWSLLPTSTSYRTTAAEGIGTAKGQWADPYMVEALGNVYLYTSIATDGTTAATQVGCAVALNTSIAALTQTNEGMLNIPLPSDAGLAIQMGTSSSDAFSGADSNPIAAPWAQLFTGASFSPGQVASNLYESTVAGNNADSYYSTVWPNNQWVSIKVGALTDSGCFVGINLRAAQGAFASANTYRIYLKGPLGATAKYAITQYINGSLTSLVAETTVTVAAGDVLTAAAVGNQISVYLNGNLISTVAGTGAASGVAGILATPSVGAGVTGASISSFAGGSVQTPSASGTAFDILFRGRLYVTRVVTGL